MLANFVALPDDAKILILGLVTSLLTALFAFLFTKWGLDLRGFVPELAAVLAAIVVTAFEFLLQMLAFVPDNILSSIIHLIVLMITGYGVVKALAKARLPGYRNPKLL
jgi:hypothetical protein